MMESGRYNIHQIRWTIEDDDSQSRYTRHI